MQTNPTMTWLTEPTLLLNSTIWQVTHAGR